MTRSIKFINKAEAKATKKFLKQAMIYGTDEYYELRNFKEENPKVKVLTRKIRRKEGKRVNNKNLTYVNMINYIKNQPNSQDLLNEFNHQKVLASIMPNPYNHVKNWFLKTLNNPDLSDKKYNKKLNSAEYEEAMA